MTDELWGKIIQIEDRLEAAQRLSRAMWVALSSMSQDRDCTFGGEDLLGFAELAFVIHDNARNALSVLNSCGGKSVAEADHD